MRKLLKHPLAKHPLVLFEALLLVLIIIVVPIVTFASSITISEYPLSAPTAHAAYITTGPDGNMWFTEMQNNKVGYISPSTRQITEFSLPIAGSSPYYNGPTGIAKGADGNLWVTDEYTEKVSKVTPSGVVISYSLPGGSVQPNSIVAGPDGNLWITLYGSNTIDVMNTSGSVLHSYSVSGGPEGISVGPDGNIWFAEQNNKQVVKMNPSNGTYTAYPVVTTVEDTAAGPDGNVWFSLLLSSQIGKINVSTGAVTYYPLPVSTSYIASFITAGPDGNVWFSLAYVGLGMLNPSTGAVTVYPTPSASTGAAWGVTAGPDKNIWYTVNNNYSKIGVANLGLSPPPPAGSGSGSSDGNTCPTQPSQQNSTSECSAEAPGHTNTTPAANNPTTPATSNTPNASSNSPAVAGIVVTKTNNGHDTTASVAASVDLSGQSYTVPANQTLYVDGSLGSTVVDPGGTFKGNGKVTDLVISKGGNLAPGHSPGCITANDLTILGTYSNQLGGTAVCKGYDQVTVKGDLTLGGQLTVSQVNGFTPQARQSFVIINNASTKPVNGIFADLPEGTIFFVNKTPMIISYKGGDGNDVTLTALSQDAYLSSLNASPKNMAKQTAISRATAFIRQHAFPILGSLITLFVLTASGVYWLVRKERNHGTGTKPSSPAPVPPATPTPLAS